MVIFDEKKMEQKPIYPTKKTPSYADWALFNMGKELEQSIPSGVTVDQEVIAGSENAVAGGAVKTYVDTEVAGVNGVPDSTTVDTGKVLTVDSDGNANWEQPTTPQITVDQTVIADSTNPVAGGGVKTYVDTEIAGVNEVPDSTAADANKILTVDANGEPNWTTPLTPQIIVDQTVIAGSTNPVAGGGVKTYVDTEIAGVNEVPNSSASDVDKVLIVDEHGTPYWGPLYDITDELPGSTTHDTGKVLTVNSSGNAEWDSIDNLTEQTVMPGGTEPVSGGAVKNYVDTEIAGINEVPSSTSSDEDKILIVNNQGTPEWGYVDDITDTLPGSVVADAGKVLTVNSSGNAEWQAPSGGVTRHTYNTFAELANDIISHSDSFLLRVHKPINYNITSTGVVLYLENIKHIGSTIRITSCSAIISSTTGTSLQLNGYSISISGTTITSSSEGSTYNISEMALYY